MGMARLSEKHELVLKHLDSILERWIGGESFRSLAQKTFVDYGALMYVLNSTVHGKSAYQDAKAAKAHQLIDQAEHLATVAGDAGEKMLDSALIKTGVTTALTLAKKLDPDTWGDKQVLDLSISGAIDHDMKITPLEAYQKLLKGGLSGEQPSP